MMLESMGGEDLSVVEAGDYPNALAAARAESGIGLGLIDLRMPGMDGFSGIEALCRASPAMRVVVMTASEDPQDLRRSLEAGARGYITKSLGGRTMMEAIQRVLDGDTFISPRVPLPADDLPGSSDEQSERLKEALTPRQRDVLSMLRQGKSNKEIARDLTLAEITVKLHVTAILRTLGVENRTQAAILAARMGL